MINHDRQSVDVWGCSRWLINHDRQLVDVWGCSSWQAHQFQKVIYKAILSKSANWSSFGGVQKCLILLLQVSVTICSGAVDESMVRSFSLGVSVSCTSLSASQIVFSMSFLDVFIAPLLGTNSPNSADVLLNKKQTDKILPVWPTYCRAHAGHVGLL